jgi:hypothetical protein
MKGCINCDFDDLEEKQKIEIATAIWESLEKMGKNPKDFQFPGAENILDFVRPGADNNPVQSC